MPLLEIKKAGVMLQLTSTVAQVIKCNRPMKLPYRKMQLPHETTAQVLHRRTLHSWGDCGINTRDQMSKSTGSLVNCPSWIEHGPLVRLPPWSSQCGRSTKVKFPRSKPLWQVRASKCRYRLVRMSRSSQNIPRASAYIIYPFNKICFAKNINFMKYLTTTVWYACIES